jgi:hypothetical protein
VVDWVLALWTERLVGGEPLCIDDPPVIQALAGVSPLQAYRLCHATGLTKIVLATQPGVATNDRLLQGERGKWFTERLGSLDSRAREWARREIQTLLQGQLIGRRQISLLGLGSMARLLADCDPFRVRWTLQHLPYAIAKRIRSLMTVSSKPSIAVARLDSLLLKTAWERLTLEGRVTMAHPDNNTRARDVC